MNRRNQNHTLLGITVVAIFVMGIFIAVTRSIAPDRISLTGQSATNTPTSPPTLTPPPIPTSDPFLGKPMLIAQEAVSRCLSIFPENNNPHGVTSKLISFQTLSQQWLGPDYAIDEVSSTDAVWLVGILGDNMVVGHTLGMGFDGLNGITAEQADPRPAEGMYCAFQAGSSSRLANGALMNSNPMRSYSLLQALPTETVPIVRPTIDPFYLTP